MPALKEKSSSLSQPPATIHYLNLGPRHPQVGKVAALNVSVVPPHAKTQHGIQKHARSLARSCTSRCCKSRLAFCCRAAKAPLSSGDVPSDGLSMMSTGSQVSVSLSGPISGASGLGLKRSKSNLCRSGRVGLTICRAERLRSKLPRRENLHMWASTLEPPLRASAPQLLSLTRLAA